jgi:adenosylcobinamide-phosphate synthase
MFGRMPMLIPVSRVDPLLILLGALALDLVVGDLPSLFRRIPHPVVMIGRLVAALEHRLNRAARSVATRRVRGGLVVLFVVAVSALAGWGVLRLTRGLAWGWAIELFVAAILLAQRSLYDHVARVWKALETRELADAQKEVSHIVGRDPASLDSHGVARAGIESLAENFADGVVAPAFWYILLGLPGMLAYKAVNTLDSMIGHRSPRYLAFGFAAARLDTIANFIPARLAGIIFALAALITPAANPRNAVRVMLRDARKHKSVNAGWPEGAVAGALGIALAGPRRYGTEVVNDEWIGDGRARATALDMRRALYLYVVAGLIHAALIGALALWLKPIAL